jgi:hypothetical protein
MFGSNQDGPTRRSAWVLFGVAGARQAIESGLGEGFDIVWLPDEVYLVACHSSLLVAHRLSMEVGGLRALRGLCDAPVVDYFGEAIESIDDGSRYRRDCRDAIAARPNCCADPRRRS